MTGAPASGKSTTAHELAAQMGAAVLDQDSMTNPMLDVVCELIGAADYSDARVAELTREARYEGLLNVACDCLRAGVPVVLIAPFTSERESAAAWAVLESRLTDSGGRASLVWIRVGPELLAQRMTTRGAPRDAQKLADIAGYVSRLNLEPPLVPHLEVDGAHGPAAQVSFLMQALADPSR
jgi:predicted kinase